MIFGSVCSGIEAASVAWHPLGWRAAFVSEIDKFPCAVLAHHYPNVPNFGDMTRFKDWPDVSIDVLVGGTPCQSFSVAGLRQGMADPRGNLALTYLAIADRFKPRWLIWENVPGVLSSNDGRDFGAIVGGMGQLGYGLAYRVLDAQYVRVDGLGRAVAQRRRRVFVVGYLGDWRRAAAVLFERESLHGDTPPRRTTGQGVAGSAAFGIDSDCFDRSGEGVNATAGERSGLGVQAELSSALRSKRPNAVAFGGNKTDGPIDVATARNAHAGPHGRLDFESETFVAHALRAEGHDASEDGTGRGTPLIAVETTGHQGDDVYSHDAPTWPTLAANSANNGGGGGGGGAILMQPITFQANASGDNLAPTVDHCFTLKAGAESGWQNGPAVAFDMRGREGGSQFEGPHDTANIRAASGGSSKSYVVGSQNADAKKTRSIELLRALQDALGEEASRHWRAGVDVAFQAPEVLRQEVHGGGVRRETDEVGCRLDDGPLSRPEGVPAWPMSEVWEAGRAGRAPRRRGLSEQLARELDEALSELSHQGAQGREALHDMWFEAQSLGPLQSPLHSAQRRPSSAVRRLTPIECARLQGFPDAYLSQVTWRGKAPPPDGPQYKALGNSMAVNVMRWIGTRIDMVEAAMADTPATRAAE